VTVVQPSETRYAKTPEGVHIAYRTMGKGSVDLIWLPDWIAHAEVILDHPLPQRGIERLASIARLIWFDKRGIGLSDRVAPQDVPSLEMWVDDLHAVMGAAGSERAILFGHGHGGQLAILSAAAHPERTAGQILYNAYARLSRTPDYPHGYPPGPQEFVIAKQEEEWGMTGWTTELIFPSLLGDATFKRFWARLERNACGPATALAMQKAIFELDVRPLLGSISVPTLVLHAHGNRHVRVGHGRYLADNIPGAKYIELQSDDHYSFSGPINDIAFAEVARFLGAVPDASDTERVLSTLLFTDIVQSTEIATKLGDRPWHEVLNRLDQVVRRHLDRFRGRLVKSTGDGHLTIFDGPGRGIRCARAISDEAASLGLELRCGLHTGEVDVRGDDVVGIAVHVAQRVSGLAGPREVLVSRTVRDLVAGSGFAFVDKGSHQLKGVAEEQHLYSVDI
jgi:class 3 adenylate cyclase